MLVSFFLRSHDQQRGVFVVIVVVTNKVFDKQVQLCYFNQAEFCCLISDDDDDDDDDDDGNYDDD